MAEKLDPKQVVTFGRLLVGLLVLAVLGVGCYAGEPGHWRSSSLDAMIFDLRENHIVGTLYVCTEGIVIIPIKFAFTETRACNTLGTAIAKVLAGEDPSRPHVLYNRYAPTEIESHDAVTAVLYQFGGEFSVAAKENKFVACIARAIHEAHPTVRFIPSDEFRRTAFPDLTPEEASLELSGQIEPLLKESTFRDRIAPLGVRSVITVWGSTHTHYRVRGTLGKGPC